MIYTSYFAGLRNLPETIAPIAISRSVPNWYSGERYFKLAPSWELLQHYKQSNDPEQYTRWYNIMLRNLDATEVVKDLSQIAQSKPFALLCYEKPSSFCHRHLVADWLERNGFSCKEWRGVL